MTIIHRSALVFYGHNPAPNVAAVVVDHEGRHVVTWDDVMRERREKQKRRLDQIRYVEEWRAVKLWVAHFGNGLMGGWHAFIDGIVQGCGGLHVWIDRDGKGYIDNLMRLFPLETDWHAWKQAFAKKYKKRRQDRKPVGVVYLWRKRWELRLIGQGCPS